MTRREILIDAGAATLAASFLPLLSAGTQDLRVSRKAQVCVFAQPGFPSYGAPSNLMELLRSFAETEVAVADVDTIVKNGIGGTIFCNSHGEAFPCAIEQRVFEFISNGGGLFHIGGVPFERPMIHKSGTWELYQGEGATCELQARLGLHKYAPAFPVESKEGLSERFDPDLIGLSPLSGNLPAKGLNVTTTMPMYVASPRQFGVHSTAYLAKPVCRHTHLAGSLVGADGRPLLSSLLLTKTWRNPYRAEPSTTCRPWSIHTGIYEGEMPRKLFESLSRWVTCPAFVGEVELERATIRSGEAVAASARLYGEVPPGWKLVARSAHVSLDQWMREEAIEWTEIPVEHAGSAVQAKVEDQGDRDAFLLPIQFVLKDENSGVRDYSESAVVPWRPEALRTGPRLRRNGAYFDFEVGRRTSSAGFLVGSNWQDSEAYGLTWHNPNPLRLAADGRSMAEAGLRVLRVHYLMPEYFKVTVGDVYRRTHSDFYNSFETGPELTERHIRALEAHAMVFGRLGLVFMPTMYTNVGPSMGNAKSWWGSSERYELADMIAMQESFARQVMSRLGGIPSISWDIINEADIAMSLVGRWTSGMKPIWGATGQTIGIGTGEIYQNLLLGESVDWHSIHADCTKDVKRQVFRSGKPCFFHEAWAPTPSTSEGEQDVERILGATIARTVTRGGCGFMPWNWNKLLAYWKYGVSWVESWDRDLGAATQGDGVRRRGWFALRNWATLLRGLSFDQTESPRVVYLHPLWTMETSQVAAWVDLLREERVAFQGVNDQDFAAFDLARTKVVVVPHYAMGFRDRTFEKLSRFAKEGGVVWAHSDTLRRDERGQLDRRRPVRFSEATEQTGKGAMEWYFGWTITEVAERRFRDLLRKAGLRRVPLDTLPLKEGNIRFTSTDNGVTLERLEVFDQQAELERAWAAGGCSFRVAGREISSSGTVFLVRKGPGVYWIHASEIRMRKSNGPASVALVDERSPARQGRLDLTGLNRREENGDLVIRLESWQRAYWIELTFLL